MRTLIAVPDLRPSLYDIRRDGGVDAFDVAQNFPVVAPGFAILRQPAFGVFGDADQIQPHQVMRVRSAGPVLKTVHHLLGGVRSLAAVAQGVEFFVLRAVAGLGRCGRKRPAPFGSAVDRASSGGIRRRGISRPSCRQRARGPFEGAVENEAVIGALRMPPHDESGGTDRDALMIEPLGRAVGLGCCPLLWLSAMTGWMLLLARNS